MKFRHMSLVTKPWLAVILLLVLLPFVAVAQAAPAIDVQLIQATGPGEQVRVKPDVDEILALNVVSGAAFAAKCDLPKSKRPRIDLFDLILFFMIPKSASYNLLPWDTGDQAGSPIKWKTQGPEPEPSSSGDRRKGEAVVTIDGKAILVRRKALEPMPWPVLLIGSRAGVRKVLISCPTSRCTVPLERELAKRKIKFQLYKCLPEESATGDEKMYSIEARGKKRAWINHVLSCGSAGCSTTFVLFLTKEAADEVPDLVPHCPE